MPLQIAIAGAPQTDTCPHLSLSGNLRNDDGSTPLPPDVSVSARGDANRGQILYGDELEEIGPDGLVLDRAPAGEELPAQTVYHSPVSPYAPPHRLLTHPKAFNTPNIAEMLVAPPTKPMARAAQGGTSRDAGLRESPSIYVCPPTDCAG